MKAIKVPVLRPLVGIRNKFIETQGYLRHVDEFSPKMDLTATVEDLEPQGFSTKNEYIVSLTVHAKTRCNSVEFKSEGSEYAQQLIVTKLYEGVLSHVEAAQNACFSGDRMATMHFLDEIRREITG